MTAEKQQQYLTPSEVSDRYSGQVSVRTLANWRWAGTGPRFTKVGGKILYRIEELVAWENRRTVEHTSEYRR